MRWRKCGLVFDVRRRADWMWSHASLPAGRLVGEDVLRIYFGTRDKERRSRPTFIDVRASDPGDVLYVHDRPILDFGELGTFDDSGLMPACTVDFDRRVFLYYIGWNPSTTVPYRLSIGLAASDDGGTTFARVWEGPVVDRSPAEPHLATAPFVLKEGARWRMWYVSGTGWTRVDGHPEPLYDVKYAESDDGVAWRRSNLTCIGPQTPEEAIGRPCVVPGDPYRMWFSYRGSRNFRSDRAATYRIGYAESPDGVRWQRNDGEAGIGLSESGWDSLMIEYPFVYRHGGQTFLLYNGNGFGASGIGYAVLEEA
jgi:hypothetical protein